MEANRALDMSECLVIGGHDDFVLCSVLRRSCQNRKYPGGGSKYKLSQGGPGSRWAALEGSLIDKIVILNDSFKWEMTSGVKGSAEHKENAVRIARVGV